MTTTPADSDATDAVAQSPTREAEQCEAGLRRVLSYICARRHRRLIAFTGVFLLIHSVAEIPVSLVSPVVSGLVITYIHSKGIIIGPEMYAIFFSITQIIPSLAITLLIFMRLRQIYKNYILPREHVAASDSD